MDWNFCSENIRQTNTDVTGSHDHSIPASIQPVLSSWVCGGRESPLPSKYGILYAGGAGCMETGIHSSVA